MSQHTTSQWNEERTAVRRFICDVYLPTISASVDSLNGDFYTAISIMRIERMGWQAYEHVRLLPLLWQ
jgi:hypothetical protein